MADRNMLISELGTRELFTEAQQIHRNSVNYVPTCIDVYST